MRHQDEWTDAQWHQMAQAHELQRQRLLQTPELHTAAGMSSGAFFAICELIKASHEEPEHYETNLPYFFCHGDIATDIHTYRQQYPHLFQSVGDGGGGLIKPGMTRWQLSWCGRSFFKEYPYQIDIDAVDGKLQTHLDCTWDAWIAGVPMYIFGRLTCEVKTYNTLTATSCFIYDVEENPHEEFDFDAHEIPTGPIFQLKTGEIVEDGKDYPVNFNIEVDARFYEPHSRIDIIDGFMGLDGTIRSR